MKYSTSLNLCALIFLIALFSNSLGLKLNKPISECKIRKLIARFQPNMYFHSEETNFPLAIEDLQISWKDAELKNPDFKIKSEQPEGLSFSTTTPIYTSFYETSTDVKIVYVYLFGAADCGYTMIYKSKAGKGFTKVEKTAKITTCPAGSRNANLRHVQIMLKKNYSTITSIQIAEGGENLVSEIEIEDNTHPVLYSAKGSHRIYTTPGIKCKKILDEKTTVYETSICLNEVVTKDQKWITGNIRLLKLNGVVPARVISNEENYFSFLYSGHISLDRLNGDIVGRIKEKLKLKAKLFIKSFDEKMYTKICSIADSIDADFSAVGGRALTNQPWW